MAKKNEIKFTLNWGNLNKVISHGLVEAVKAGKFGTGGSMLGRGYYDPGVPGGKRKKGGFLSSIVQAAVAPVAAPIQAAQTLLSGGSLTQAGTTLAGGGIQAATGGAIGIVAPGKIEEDRQKLYEGLKKQRISDQIKKFKDDPLGIAGKFATRVYGQTTTDLGMGRLGGFDKAMTGTGSGRKWLRGEGRQAGKLGWLSRPIGEIVDINRRFFRDPTMSKGKFSNQLAMRELEINPPGESLQDFIGRTAGISQAQLEEFQKKEGKIARTPRISLEAPKMQEWQDNQLPKLADLGEVAKAEAVLRRRASFITRKRSMRGRSATLIGRKGAIL